MFTHWYVFSIYTYGRLELKDINCQLKIQGNIGILFFLTKLLLKRMMKMWAKPTLLGRTSGLGNRNFDLRSGVENYYETI